MRTHAGASNARSLTDANAGSNALRRPHGDVSIVIPALDEAAIIASAVRRARAQARVHEVIVADGGSRDRTPELAVAAGARVLEAPRGRGPQMNAGAGAARCDTLLFLHADCTLPQNAVRGIEAVFDAGCGAGIHRVRYASQHPLLRLTGLLTRFETRFTSFGEGALFVRRAVFDAVGGFPEWPLFEDVEILARLRRATRIGYAPEPVVVSARRYESGGVCRQQLRDAAFFVLFHAGVKPARLAHLVRKRSTGGGAPAACARSTFSP